jgi:GT2 family glycosyltransferase
MADKIGVGIITCNRPQYLKGLLDSFPVDSGIDELVVVNDGEPLSEEGASFNKDFDFSNVTWIQNEVNLGVGKSKNKALKYLFEKDCDYLFLIEDDMIILDPTVFKQYIEASKASGIQHFNYGPGSPFNRKQAIKNFDLHNRHLLSQDTEPNPKMILELKTCKIALYEHTVAMFSFFTRKVIEEIGYIDEQFYNAWEHVDHTYCIIKAGYHPPFWWFADLANSHELLTEAPGAIDNSSIANKSEQWEKNVYGGRELYLKKHGHYPNQPPYVSKEQVIEIVKKIKNDHSRK